MSFRRGWGRMVGMVCLTVCWLPLPAAAEPDAPDADADFYAGTLAYKNGDWWFTACNANEADAWRAVWQRPDDQALAGRLLAQYPPRSQQHNPGRHSGCGCKPDGWCRRKTMCRVRLALNKCCRMR